VTTASPPRYATGKICYIEIPATDIRRSAEFYQRAGLARFRDPAGNVLGIYQDPLLAKIEAQQR
jgi:hypothetical protein